jgi:tRNA (guanine-N7-)-methyltransferase
MPELAPDPLSIRRLYGRAQGHPLRERAQRLVDDLLPTLAVPAQGPLTATSLFGNDRPLAVEVGFGKGEHLAFQAARLPEWGFIGAEPYLNGIAGLLAEVEDRNLQNVRLHRGDAIDVLERLPDASLSALYLLHPDPWPKARHAKRRFVNPGPLALMHAKLRPGAQFRIATDHVNYMRHVMFVMQNQPGFEWTAEHPSDWASIPEDWPDTRFAEKARTLGHSVWRLIYTRI